VSLASIAALLALAVAPPTAAAPARPTDRLLALVPHDAAAVACVEDLRALARDVETSPLAAEFRKTPAYAAWAGSPGARRLEQAAQALEQGLGTTVPVLRDEVFGRAFVVSLHPGAGGSLAEPKGLLLIDPPDRDALARVVAALNDAERQDGRLAAVETRRSGGATYHARRHAADAGGDYYATLDAGLFAWSNDEALIQDVIRRAGAPAPPAWAAALRAELPDDASASLLIGPKAIAAAALAGPEGEEPDPGEQLVRQFLGSLESCGIAFRWGAPIELIVAERFAAGAPGRAAPSPRATASWLDDAPIPADHLVVARGWIDWTALHDALTGTLPDDQRRPLENIELALSGLLLGKSLQRDVLPQLGPRLVAFLVPDPQRSPNGPAPPVGGLVALELGGDEGVTNALVNAARTLLALAALDSKFAPAMPRVETVEVRGTRIIHLVPPVRPISLHVGPRALVVGTSDDLVADFVSGAADVPRRPNADPLDRPRNILVVNVPNLCAWIETNRAWLARRAAVGGETTVEQAGRDIDQLLPLLRPFESIYLTHDAAPDGRVWRQRFGLVPRAR
jgi:hypothetical protein